MCSRALRRAGFETAGALTVAQLREQLEAAPVDLILMDVRMPEQFGSDAAAKLRKDGVSAPIYLYSNLDDAELSHLAKAAGADGYISKYAGLEHLVRRLREILGA